MIIVGTLFLFGCADSVPHSRRQKHSESRPLFGTIIKLDACYDKQDQPDMEAAFKKVWQKLQDMQWRMNIYDERSEIIKINNSHQQPVAISQETYQLLKDAIHFSDLTHGVFDITVYPLIELWKKAEEINTTPTPENIRSAKAAVGVRNIEFLPDNQIRLRHPDSKIDINGIASGYGADEAARIFRENGIHHFLIDTGGELYASGKNCEGNPWSIGISDPRDRFKLIDTVELADYGISTSGNYEKFFDIEGRRWSHIVNPLTGYPEVVVTSATVIAPSAMEADALSTALCVLGGQKGISLIDSLGHGMAAMVIEHSGSDIILYKSSQYEKFRAKKKR